MRITTLCFALAVFALGCKHEGAITPQEEVVTQPADPKLELSGTWIVMDNVNSRDGTLHTMVIRETDVGVFSGIMSGEGEIAFELRTLPMQDQEDYAIVDVAVSIKEAPWTRLLGIAAVKDETLAVWWIESKNLARLMQAEGHSAVIERSTFESKVYAEAGELIDCISKHARELVGEPTLFRRKVDQ